MNIANNILKHSLQNVYFFVGTACGGKTTMSRALAKKHGFTCYNDNWNEEPFKIWKTIIDEKYQSNAFKGQNITDWETYFSRTVDEFLADRKNSRGDEDYVEFSIIELIKLSQNQKVLADVWIEDWQMLSEISDHSRIACLLAPGELIIRDYYQRDDHIDFTNCINSLKDPEKKFATQNELFRLGAVELAEKAKQFGLFTIMRDEDSTVEGTMSLLEKHFGF